MRRFRPALALALLAATFVAAGCGGGGDDGGGGAAGGEAAAVPAGFERFEGPGYSLAYPKGFKALPEQREAKGSTRSFVGEEGTGGLPPQVAIGRTPRDEGAFELAVEAAKADSRVRRAKWTIVSEKPVEVPGAEEARMIEARYVEPSESGDRPVRTIDLLVRTKAGAQLAVLMRAPEPDFDAAGLRKVPGTLRAE